MKRFAQIAWLSLAFICIFLSKSLAHIGGHYHQALQLNTWLLASGSTIQGNFYMAKDGAIVLEQLDGHLIKVPIDLLAQQDQALAKFKSKKYSAIHADALLNKDDYSLAAVVLLDAAFAPYKPAVQTRFDDTYYYVSSNGLPNHNMMVGITSWQQQVPLPQAYSGTNSWSIPIKPEIAATPISTKTNFMRGAVAIAVNGIPIFNALNNRGEDAFAIGELDQWGGHCGKGDDYHYHVAPLHLQATSGLLPIAFALDGFAVYGAKEPDGSSMQPLDDCHGHALNNRQYHYHGTTTYPYVIGAMKGKVVIDDSKPAPENQVSPQPSARPVRPPLKPLRGAVITYFVETSPTSRKLIYNINGNEGFVQYQWDGNIFNFTFTDINGITTTNSYERKPNR